MNITTNILPNWFLNLGDIHIWVTSQKYSEEKYETLKTILSSEELKLSQRLKASTQFIVARSFLKILLSQYLKLLTDQIEFNYGVFGKPQLAHHLQSNSSLTFNLSHSNDLVICCIGQKSQLGIDLEYKGKIRPFNEIAERFFSFTEIQEIQQASGENKKNVFYNIWTKKEALLKALGLGLHTSLKHFTISSRSNHIETLTSLSFDSSQRTWYVFSLDYNVNFSISIATDQKPKHIWLNYWDL